MESKIKFERISSQHGIDIKAYHADNGIFSTRSWREDFDEKNQKLTYSGVCAHHQNGVAEKKIQLLQTMARSMLIHAKHKWPKTVSTHLWPYAIFYVTYCLNNTPTSKSKFKETPEQLFTKSKVNINPLFFQPFASPSYVLQRELQSQQGIYNKWKERGRLGLYLGPSKHHARNIALILNIKKGLVSPQFHVQFDPKFSTITEENHEDGCLQACGFIRQSNVMPKNP